MDAASRRTTPLSTLCRAFPSALSLSCLAWASIGIFLMSAGEKAVLEWMPRDETRNSVSIGRAIKPESDIPVAGSIEAVWHQFAKSLEMVARPFSEMMSPAVRIFYPAEGFRSTWSDAAITWTLFFWNIIVWSICGGAIARRVAVRAASRQSIGFIAMGRYSRKLFVCYFSAPLLPFVGIGALYVLNVLIGSLGLIPAVGMSIMWCLWGLLMILSLLMAIIVICIAACWPLMVPAISVEGSDAFDGMSRSYSYLVGKPWQYAGAILYALLQGGVAVMVVRLLLAVTLHLTILSATGTWPDREELFGTHLISEIISERGIAGLLGNTDSGLMAIGLWMESTSWLLSAFTYSYFWSAATFVYLAMRQYNDGVDPTVIYMEPQSADLNTPDVKATEQTTAVVESENDHAEQAQRDENGSTGDA